MKRAFLFFALSVLCVVPAFVDAATKKPTPLKSSTFEVGGWIPYWRTATGTQDVLPRLSSLTTVHPFVYTLKSDGTVYDAGKMKEEPWVSFMKQAKAKKVRVIPTIMSGSGDVLHATLSNTKKRIALEDEIALLVKTNGFDGIDIDFEGKKVETKPYFSLFLKGLYQRLGNKWLYCTIEPRTPLDSRYDSTPPADAGQYANDYAAINKWCDRVIIMAYDQGAIDVKLNRARAAPYVPIADPAWVEKVMLLTQKSISKKKLLLGIPTYGYEYSVKPLQYGYRYDVQWAFNQRYAIELAQKQGITPIRNASGELSFIYKAADVAEADTGLVATNFNDNNSTVPPTLYSQAAIAGKLQPPFNIVWWSDAKAIQDKIDLAKTLGLRGVSVFKFDGGEDQRMWDVFAGSRVE